MMEAKLVNLAVLVVFLQFFVHGSNAESVFVDDLSYKSKKNAQPNNLTCYVCHSEKDADCQNITENSNSLSKTCSSNETYCMVKRISFSTSQNSTATTGQPTFVALKRNCTARCDPGCVIMGERTRLYVCSTCCQLDQCNDGNGASETQPNKFCLSLITAAIFLLLSFPTPFFQSKGS